MVIQIECLYWQHNIWTVTFVTNERSDNVMTLYIIGNGFDMAHGLNTSYWNFREYLDINYPEFLYEFERLYNIAQIDFSDPRVSEQTYKNWQSSVQRILWSNFEKNMGMPNIDGMMDLSTDSIHSFTYS